MIKFEIKKNFTIKINIVLVLIFILSCVVYYVILSGVKNADNIDEYLDIYKKISGVCTTEKKNYISGLYEDIENTLALETVMQEQYLSGKISSAEYREYRDHYHYCNTINEVVSGLYEDSKDMEPGKDYYVFDLYYEKVFDMKRALIAPLVSVIILIISVVAVEKKKCSVLLIATPKGMKAVINSKLKLLALFSFVTTVIYVGTEYVLAYLVHPFEQLSVPVNSIESLSMLPDGLTIGGFLVVFFLIRLVVLEIVAMIGVLVVRREGKK